MNYWSSKWTSVAGRNMHWLEWILPVGLLGRVVLDFGSWLNFESYFCKKAARPHNLVWCSPLKSRARCWIHFPNSMLWQLIYIHLYFPHEKQICISMLIRHQFRWWNQMDLQSLKHKELPCSQTVALDQLDIALCPYFRSLQNSVENFRGKSRS